MKSVQKIVVKLPIWLACAALFALMVMTFCDVILRSSFDAPIEAATELTRILVAVIVFSVMPHISLTGGHIAVDLTDGIFESRGLDRLRDAVLHIISAVAMVWPAWRVIELAERTRSYGDVTEYLSIPQYVIMWFIGLSVSVTALATLIAGLLILIAPRRSEGVSP